MKSGQMNLNSAFMRSFENLPILFSHSTSVYQSKHVLMNTIEQGIQGFRITKR